MREATIRGGPGSSQSPSRCARSVLRSPARRRPRLRPCLLARLDQRPPRSHHPTATAATPVQDVSNTPGLAQGEETVAHGGSDLFGALYNHTMEGVYSHPVYGGNVNHQTWKTFGCRGDAHGAGSPRIGPPAAPWNVYGGYAPEGIVKPGTGQA